MSETEVEWAVQYGPDQRVIRGYESRADAEKGIARIRKWITDPNNSHHTADRYEPMFAVTRTATTTTTYTDWTPVRSKEN